MGSIVNDELKMVNVLDKNIELANDRLLRLTIEDELENLRYLSDKGRFVNPKKIIARYPKYRNFWDAECINWKKRFSEENKSLIRDLLKKNSKGKILNIGSGSTYYKSNEISLDYSREMLKENINKRKILYDLNSGTLPFKKNSFDTIYALFSLNYIENIKPLLKVIKELLKPKGKLIAMQCPLNNWYNSQSKHSTEELINLIKTHLEIIVSVHKRTTLIIGKNG